MIVPHFLHVGAGAFAGDPPGVIGGSGYLAVEGDRGFQRNQRPSGRREVEKRLVELARFSGVLFDALNLDPCRAQLRSAAAGTVWMGIVDGIEHARNAGRDDRIDTGRCAALMRARLETDIEIGPERPLAGLFKRDDFRMLQAGIGMEAAAGDLAFAHHHGPDHRVRAGLRPPFTRQRQRGVHASGDHGSKSESINFAGSNGSKSSAFSPMPM